MATPVRTFPKTALVVGGGVIGMACAVRLQARGISTRVIDPVAVRRAASWGNAGHLAIEQVEPFASRANIRSLPSRIFSRGGPVALPLREIGAWLPFGLRLAAASTPARYEQGKAALTEALSDAIPAWRRLLEEVGARHLLIEAGHFVLWESAGAAASGRRHWQSENRGSATAHDLSSAELAAVVRLMARPPVDGIRFQGTAQISDPGALAESLGAALERLGGEQICPGVQSLDMGSSGAGVILLDGRRLEADAVVVAAGVGSGALLSPLGHKVPIIAERGYHVQARGADWPAELPPIVFEDRSMIVTGFSSGVRASSFVEFARAGSPPDPRKWQRLRRHVAALGLPFEEPIAEWRGARPTLPDYLPAIGRSLRGANIFYAFGHQHLGLTLAAVTSEAISALIFGEEPALRVEPFDLRRFGETRARA